MKRAVVILGAGASFDVANGTAPIIPSVEDRRPPLARELFDSRFFAFRQLYRGAHTLGAELGRLAARQDVPFDMETRLTEYSEHADPRTRRAFRDIPPYLRDVVNACCKEYTRSPASHLVLVQRLLRTQDHEVMFVVLNYDTFLEDALNLYSQDEYPFDGLDRYVVANRQAQVVKIHGSTNWGVPIPGTGVNENLSISWERAVDAFDPAAVTAGAIAVDDRGSPSHGWRQPGAEKAFLYPLLTAPVYGKSFSCPPDHRQALLEFLEQCHKWLIIGTSGLDDDLLEVISAHCPDEGHYIHYVGAGDNATREVQKRFEKNVRRFIAAGPRHPQPVLCPLGFTKYLDTDLLDRFLKAD